MEPIERIMQGAQHLCQCLIVDGALAAYRLPVLVRALCWVLILRDEPARIIA